MVELVGRQTEIANLGNWLNDAAGGRGNCIVLTGPAGMGKTVLAEKFRELAAEKKFTLLSGAADANTMRPFQIFSEVLGKIGKDSLLSDTKYTGFTKVFAVNRAGMLVAEASPVDVRGMDSDIFAGMLSAVQNFVRDSFDTSGNQSAGLGRLEYGSMKIIIEHGRDVFLTAVINGEEHQNMRGGLKGAAKEIEKRFGSALGAWNGDMNEVEPISMILNSLVETKFLVKKDLEGVKLEAEKLRIADSVLEALSAMAVEKPLAIVLEDIHWADESSLFVLSYLARNIEERKMTVLSTLRTEDAKMPEQVLQMVEGGTCREVPLGRLQYPEIMELVGAVLGDNALTKDFIDELDEKCEGNPFFIQEMLSHMVQEDVIAERDGRMMLVKDSYTLPENIEEAIQRRLDLLEPEVMAAAEYISCIGREFDTIIPQSSDIIIEPNEKIQMLENAGIITTEQDKGRFTQALFQEVIYNGISKRWQSAYHQNIGEIYEKFYDVPRVVYELARHFANSREHLKGFDYCIMAAETAEGSFAMDRAAQFYTMALEGMDRLGAAPDKQEKRIELNNQIGDAFLLSSALDKALLAFERMENIATEISIKVIAHRKIASVHEKKGSYEEALKETELALKLAYEESPERWKLEILNGTIFSRTGKFQEGIDSCAKAIEALANIPGTEKDVGIAYNVMGMCHWYLGNYTAAFGDYEKCLAINEKIHDYYGIASAHNNLGILFQVQGNLDGALEQQKKGLAIRQKIKDHMGIAASFNNIGLINYDLGRFDEALKMQLKGLEIRQRVGHQAGIALSYTNLGEIYKTMGEFDKAVENHLKCLKLKEVMGDKWGIANAHNNLGIVYNEKRELDLATEHFERGIELCNEIGAKEFLTHAKLGKAEALVKLGKFLEAVDITDEMEKLSQELGIKRSVCDAWSIRARALSGLEEWERAIETFNLSREGFIELKSDIDVAHVDFYLGEMHKAREEPEKAIECVNSARQVYKKLGMDYWVGKCDRFLNELGNL